MNWMLPLETLPGWPEAPEFSVYHLILIAGVLPVTVALVVAVLAFTPTWVRRFRGEAPAGGSELVAQGDASAPDTLA